MGRLQGKVAIITGGARGMGASHVRRFVEEGAKVVFTDLLVKEGQALSKELGKNAKFLKQDVSKERDWRKVVQRTEEVYGPIHILVNNAGIDQTEENLAEADIDQYHQVIQVNQNGVFLGMRAVVDSMRRAGGGSIINISSLAGLVGAVQKIAYTASKFAVRGMTKAAALELAPYGIRVNSVHPGFIETPMTERLINEELVSMFPIKRAGKPEEVTNLVVYLASDESSYSTGSEFIIDGGMGAM